MPADQVLLLVAAGIGAGLVGSIAGLASLVSYPVLLSTGLAAVPANVTNTAALIWAGVGAVLGSRPELTGQGRRLARLLPLGMLGGTAGAFLVVLTPSSLFRLIVPWLIAFAAAVIVVPGLRRRPRPRLAPRVVEPLPVAAGPDRRVLAPAVGTISIYSGYFGAAGGVIMLATLLAATDESLARANATKNAIAGAANLAATVVFAAYGVVHWLVAIPLAFGFLVGSRIGPVVVRRLPARPLRLAIGAAGFGLAVSLAYQAYR